MRPAQTSAERVFAPGAQRPVDAEAWLSQLLRSWGIPVGSAVRWLSPARPVLERADELVVHAQYDPVMLLLTIELWSGGRRLYGIDDWLG